jgi:hypothetical protein
MKAGHRVPADDEVDPVSVEQRQPVAANTEVGPVGPVGGRDRCLMHAHHDPVDASVVARCGEFCFQPTLLGAARIAVHIGVAGVLQADVVIVQADDPNRSRGERIPQPAQLGVRTGVG